MLLVSLLAFPARWHHQYGLSPPMLISRPSFADRIMPGTSCYRLPASRHQKISLPYMHTTRDTPFKKKKKKDYALAFVKRPNNKGVKSMPIPCWAEKLGGQSCKGRALGTYTRSYMLFYSLKVRLFGPFIPKEMPVIISITTTSIVLSFLLFFFLLSLSALIPNGNQIRAS